MTQAANAIWGSFRNRYRVTGILQAETAIRVGCGSESIEPTGVDLPVFREGEVPVIPGSSLRGAVRSHLERIVRALEPECGHGGGACMVLDDTGRCVSSEVYQKLRKEVAEGDPAELSEEVYRRSCRVCRLFGSPWLASRLCFQDAYPMGSPEVVRRDGVSIDREKETVENKYDFEVVGRGARFGLEIVADNLESEEVGLLFLILRELEQGRIMVGGFKGRGLGRVRLIGTQVEMVDGRNRNQLVDFLISGRARQVPQNEIDATLKGLAHALAEVG